MKILNKTRGKGLSEMSGQFFGLTLEWARIHFFRLYMQRQKQASTKQIKHKHHRTNQVFFFPENLCNLLGKYKKKINSTSWKIV